MLVTSGLLSCRPSLKVSLTLLRSASESNDQLSSMNDVTADRGGGGRRRGVEWVRIGLRLAQHGEISRYN